MQHRPLAELEANLDAVRASPSRHGRLDLIVLRPAFEQRELVEEACVDVERGMRTPGGSADSWWERMNSLSNPNTGAVSSSARAVAFRRQIALINVHFARLVAGSPERAPLCGDQLHVDWDLSTDNLPVGSQVRIGDALLEITPKPHRGCRKFAQRFGPDALTLVRTRLGQQLRLRGVYARVVENGHFRIGDSLSIVADRQEPTAADPSANPARQHRPPGSEEVDPVDGGSPLGGG